jgi:branched-subunit amino acid ABC-type transport system permease component
LLNGLQFGVMLFLLAAGLTLIFGIMGVINLAHGSLYMVGAYAAAFAAAQTGSVVIAIIAGLAARRPPSLAWRWSCSCCAGSMPAIISIRCWRPLR